MLQPHLSPPPNKGNKTASYTNHHTQIPMAEETRHSVYTLGQPGVWGEVEKRNKTDAERYGRGSPSPV